MCCEIMSICSNGEVNIIFELPMGMLDHHWFEKGHFCQAIKIPFRIVLYHYLKKYYMSFSWLEVPCCCKSMQVLAFSISSLCDDSWLESCVLHMLHASFEDIFPLKWWCQHDGIYGINEANIPAGHLSDWHQPRCTSECSLPWSSALGL